MLLNNILIGVYLILICNIVISFVTSRHLINTKYNYQLGGEKTLTGMNEKIDFDFILIVSLFSLNKIVM